MASKLKHKNNLFKDIPRGMRYLAIFMGLGFIQNLVYLYISTPLSLGPFVVSGNIARSLNIIFAVVTFISLLGILKQKKWGLYSTLGLYVYSAVSLVSKIFFVTSNKSLYASYYKELLTPEAYLEFSHKLDTNVSLISSIIELAIILLIISYIHKKRSYFVN